MYGNMYVPAQPDWEEAFLNRRNYGKLSLLVGHGGLTKGEPYYLVDNER